MLIWSHEAKKLRRQAEDLVVMSPELKQEESVQQEVEEDGIPKQNEEVREISETAMNLELMVEKVKVFRSYFNSRIPKFHKKRLSVTGNR